MTGRMMTPLLRHSLSKAALAGCLAMGITGCGTLEQVAPSVEAVSSSHSTQLNAGRDLYITKCAKCHAPEPVTKYSAREWEAIIPEMAEETKLSADETAALRAYVTTVLKMKAVSNG